MSDVNAGASDPGALFDAAEWYDQTINWTARLKREIPVLREVLSPPGDGGILDAGCGTAHQAIALAGHGYSITGADASTEMLRVARRNAEQARVTVDFTLTPYETLFAKAGGDFDGLICLGNSLAAAGTRDGVARAVDQFARCLRTAGRLFLQVLNFAPMQNERPCIRGPRITEVAGREYISIRHFSFDEDSATVSNITLWEDGEWKCRSHAGVLYPVSPEELGQLCDRSGLRIDETWGSYAREPFDPERSNDLILVATRG